VSAPEGSERAPFAHLDESRLDDLADGVLTGPTRDVAERHVAACERCARALAETRALLATGRAARGVPAPPELWPLVAASTVHAVRLRRRTLRSMRGVLVLAALALVLGTAAATVIVMKALGLTIPRQPAAPPAPSVPRVPNAPPAPRAPRAPPAPRGP
jgi:anti-sigma factor RsiW